MRIHPRSPVPSAALLLLAGLIFGSTGCGPREEPPPPVSAAPSPAPAETKPEPGAPAGPAPMAPSSATTPKAAPPSTAPSAVKPVPPSGVTAAIAAPAAVQGPPPAAKPAAPAPAPVQATSPVSDPGGEVAVKPTKDGLARVGAASCKMCHKIQFASWSETAHAKRTPPLDCESCHGPGSEYKAMATMKDPAKAKAAGLVHPGAPFCATCHKRNWNDGMLKKAHAHKA